WRASEPGAALPTPGAARPIAPATSAPPVPPAQVLTAHCDGATWKTHDPYQHYPCRRTKATEAEVARIVRTRTRIARTAEPRLEGMAYRTQLLVPGCHQDLRI